jgi:flagellar hook-associated protein 2
MRLVISSTNPGTANLFKISASGNAGDLSYDPETQSGGMALSQPAADAKLNVNGVDIVSSSNTLSGTIQGLSLNLLKTTDTAVQVGVAQDTTTVKASIQGFVDAYNGLASMLATQTKYDAATKTAGKLQGDSTAVSLQRQLRNALSSVTGASNVFSTVNDIGLTTQSDGTLKVNDTKLSTALTNLGEVKKMFSGASTTDSTLNGVATRLRMFGDAVLGTDGALTTRTTGLNSSLTVNQKQQDAITARLALTEARLRAQYTSLDTQMSKMTALNTYITNQVAQWNKA